MDKELTGGQKAVGLNFNPSNNDNVNVVKRKCADMIDMLDAQVFANDLGKDINREAKLAVLRAQMMVVKSITFEE